jgi:ataxia telangiectasia mutated family protein
MAHCQKLLPIPEIVPFRLTRDIVDGMGPVGTEGIFIATAITTLTVLRENTNSLMTILSAVVSDPLYKWCMNPVTARLRQRDKSDDDIESEWNTNKNTHILSKSDDPVVSHALSAREINDNESDAASRTLAKIMSKLQGFEDGGSGERQTVEGQVRMLIQAAKDPSNLAHMYCGWAPWL